MKNLFILSLTLFLTISFAQAAKVVKVKGKSVMLKDDDASSFSTGDKLRIKDGSGKTKGIIKISKIKGSVIVGKLLKGKAQKGWEGSKVASKVKKSNKSESNESSENTKSSNNKSYISAGGGIYAATADNYDRSMVVSLEYGTPFSSFKKLSWAATFLYSTEVLDNTTFSGVGGNFSFKQTSLHFLGQVKYDLLDYLYVNLLGGYFTSSGTMTNITTLESLKLDRSGPIFGLGLGTKFNMGDNGFIDVNYSMISYSVSSLSFNGEEQENISASDNRSTVTFSYGYRF